MTGGTTDVKLFVACPNLACKKVCALLEPIQELSERDDAVRYRGTIEPHMSESIYLGEHVYGVVERADGERVSADAFVIKQCERSGDAVAIFVKLR